MDVKNLLITADLFRKYAQEAPQEGGDLTAQVQQAMKKALNDWIIGAQHISKPGVPISVQFSLRLRFSVAPRNETEAVTPAVIEMTSRPVYYRSEKDASGKVSMVRKELTQLTPEEQTAVKSFMAKVANWQNEASVLGNMSPETIKQLFSMLFRSKQTGAYSYPENGSSPPVTLELFER